MYQRRIRYQLFVAVLAALELRRSVRVALTRPQMFGFGPWPHALQRLKLGTDETGARGRASRRAGRILNFKTARSQVLGSVVWGIARR